MKTLAGAAQQSNSIQVNVRGLAASACLAICDLFIRGPLKSFNFRNRALGGRFDSTQNYVADRVSNIEGYSQLFSRFGAFQGRTVMELGCNSGYLLDSFRQRTDFVPIGVDIDGAALERARKQYGPRIQFVQSTAASIPLPDNSVDVAYSVDTVEHLSRPYEIFSEVYRILRPGGHFLVHFHPWLGPYGSHLEDTLPLPWLQTIFSMKTLLNVCAHLYERRDYKAACYWFDPETGERRPNPYLDVEKWQEFLNRMTILRFRKELKRLPFRQVHFQKLGFGGKAFKAARFMKGLAQVPLLDEYFVYAVFAVLEKQSNTQVCIQIRNETDGGDGSEARVGLSRK